MRRPGIVLLGLLAVVCPACGGEGGPATAPSAGTATRTFAMGLGDFPHAFTTAALDFGIEAIRRDADLMMVHLDDGVPWEEAAAGRPYPAEYQSDLERRARAQPLGHLRYLAVTPLNFLRDGLAARRGPTGSEALRPPWDRMRFDDPAAIEAYSAHCERMIALFAPDHFVYGVEVNILFYKRPDLWPELGRMLSAVHARIKARHPALSVSLTFQVDFLRASSKTQAEGIRAVLPFSDLVGASTYAYERESDPGALPADFFDGLIALGGGKRFFVAETGWPAEPVTSPYPAFIAASEEAQRRYVEWLLGQAERHRAVLVNWIISRDYDELWESHLKGRPEAPLLRLWKDIGLYRGDGTSRPARDAWRVWLAKSRRPAG